MKYVKMLGASVLATLVMTGFLLLAPLVGLPDPKIQYLLGGFFGGNIIAGWIAHFVIGFLFVIPYAMLFNRLLPVENKVARGAIYGIIVFVFSEIIITGANMTGHLNWDIKESMGLMVFVNSIACILYGVVLGFFFERVGVDSLEYAKTTH